MKLREVIAHLVANHETGLAQSTENFYRAVDDCFSAFLGRRALADDLNSYRVNEYIRWMSSNRASSTVKSQRGGLMVLWRYAAKIGACPAPGIVRNPKLKRPVVWAWTLDEVTQLRDHSLGLDGKINGIQRRWYFASLFSAGYETGFRLGDLLLLEHSWLMPSGKERQITIVESKTGKQTRRLISETTVCLVDRCMGDQPNRRLIWPVAVRREQLYRQIRRIVADSGIRKGTFRHLRRTAATQVEIHSRGSGQRFLSHSDASTTDNHYLDAWQVDPVPLRPTPLPQIGPE